MIQLIFLIATMAAWFDGPPQDDSHLIFRYSKVPPEENSFHVFIEASQKIVDDSEIDEVFAGWNRQRAADICKKNSAALELWQKGLAMNRLQAPEVTGYDALLPYLSKWRKLARLASLQARLYAEQEQYKDAMSFSLDIIRFGKLQESSDGCLVNYLVAIACKTIGIHRVRQIVHDHRVPTDILVSTSRQLSTFKCDRQALQNALRIEYTMTHNMIEDIVAGRFQNAGLMFGGETVALMRKVPMPLLFKKNGTLNLFNGIYTDLIENASLPVHKRKKLSYRRPRGWELVSSNVVGKAMCGMLIPSLTGTESTLDRADIELDFLRLQIAISLYRNANDGQWPDHLSVLTPKWLKALPADLYSRTGHPYRYSAPKRMIYTVGSDGIDSGGEPLKAFEKIAPFTVVWKQARDPGVLLDESLVTKKLPEPPRRKTAKPHGENKLERFDENGDGIVDDNEIRRAATAILERMEQKGLQGQWATFDADADGILNTEEREKILSNLIARLKSK